MELKGAEIFDVGTHNGRTFVDDLTGIERSFDALGLSGRIPLKLGHDGDDAARWRAGPRLGQPHLP